MTEDFAIKLLEYGPPGLAVVLLFLAYRLLTRLQDALLTVDVEKFDSPHTFAAWSRLAKATSRNAMAFMAISVIFFAGGVYFQIVDPENEIIVSVAPPDGVRPVVKLQETEQKLDEEGKVELPVRNQHVLRVVSSKLIELLNDRTKERDNLRNQLQLLINENVSGGAAPGVSAEGEEAGF